MGLGSAIWLAHPELATVKRYDDDRTLVYEVETKDGGIFEVCCNMDYAGVRLFTEMVEEDRQEALGAGADTGERPKPDDNEVLP